MAHRVPGSLDRVGRQGERPPLRFSELCQHEQAVPARRVGGGSGEDAARPRDRAFAPREVGYFIPEPVAGRKAPQSNDVTLDDRGLIYMVDRNIGFDVLEFGG